MADTIMSVSGMLGESMRNTFTVDELARRHSQVHENIADLKKGGHGIVRHAELWSKVEKHREVHKEQRAQLEKMVAADMSSLLGSGTGEAVAKEREREILELIQRKEEINASLEDHLEDMRVGAERQLEGELQRDGRRTEILVEQQQTAGADSSRRECEVWVREGERRVARLESVEREYAQYRHSGAGGEDTQRRMQIQALEHELEQEDAELSTVEDHVGKLKQELAQKERELARAKQTAELHQMQAEAAETHGEAGLATWKQEIALLKQKHAEQEAKIKEWESFDSANPGFPELEQQLEGKHESLAQAKIRVRELHDEERKLGDALAEEYGGIEDIRAVLSSVADSVPPLQQDAGIDPAQTLACCFPDPCPVGQKLGLVITTCDAARNPIVGALRSELTVRRIQYPALGPPVVGAEVPVDDVLDGGCHSSAFTSSYVPDHDGRSGFEVLFRGHTFRVSACVPPPPPPMLREVMEVSQQKTPLLTVHCTPASVTVGGKIEIAVVVRKPGTLLPQEHCDVAAESLQCGSYGTLYGARPAPLQQLREGSPVFLTELIIPPTVKQQGNVRQHVGVEVMALRGADAARASARLVADPASDTVLDAASASLVCLPDPAVVGERVSVFITERNEYMLPITADAGLVPPALEPVGTATLIRQPRLGSSRSLVWVGSFVADRVGRAGVRATFPGREATTRRATVEVLTPGPFDPAKTELTLSPPVVQLGETVQVAVVTKDADGRPSPGPAPQLLKLTKVGGATELLPLRRVEGSLSEYCAVLRTTPDGSRPAVTAGHAGCQLSLKDASFSARVKISGRPLDAAAPQRDPDEPAPAAPPRHMVAFQRDGVTPGMEVAVLMAAHEDAPGRGRVVPTPTLRAVANCEVVHPPVGVVGTKSLWQAVVRIGSDLGTASVDAVFTAGAACRCSTTVEADRWGSLTLEMDRLREMGENVRSMLLAERHRAAQLSRREAELQRRAEVLKAREQGEITGRYVLFGLQLSDGINYGGTWEPFDSCKIVDIIEGGPVDQAKHTDGTKPEAGDFVLSAQWTDPESGFIDVKPATSLESFKLLCEELSLRYPTGGLPSVQLRLLRGTDEFRVAVFAGRTDEKPGRYVGTMRYSTHLQVEQAEAGSPRRGRSPALQGSPVRVAGSPRARVSSGSV
eukprot:TRINITY_DN4931_c1_g2_i1.p1 TRINITY_DN4931_c1_g2~~TRINITY_DN4931_c1_g2_i1.p1  ORF type:complete len:1229 (+),score=419.73 TRINITY_DN4931_c1_g2_i1:229-3687(+)